MEDEALSRDAFGLDESYNKAKPGLQYASRRALVGRVGQVHGSNRAIVGAYYRAIE